MSEAASRFGRLPSSSEILESLSLDLTPTPAEQHLRKLKPVAIPDFEKPSAIAVHGNRLKKTNWMKY